MDRRTKKKKEENLNKQKNKSNNKNKVPSFQLDDFVEETNKVSDMVSCAIEDALSIEMTKKRKRSELKESTSLPPAKRMRGDPLFDDIENDQETKMEEEEEEEQEREHVVTTDNIIISNESTEPSIDSTAQKETKKEEVVMLNLLDFDSIDQLKELGLDKLKNELLLRGLKCGGNLDQRAERLMSIKGKSKEDWDKRLFSAPPKKKKNQ